MPKKMADGMNEIRAIRLTEIVQDFRKLQHYIAQIRTTPTAEEYNGQGYALLRQCAAEGQASLRQPFTPAAAPNGDPDKEKAQLQQVILDASVRRFQAQKIYLRATAAMRWINTRHAILEGASPSPQHAAALQDIDNKLQAELASITDRKVLDGLKEEDQKTGKWITEDPSLSSIQAVLSSRR